PRPRRAARARLGRPGRPRARPADCLTAVLRVVLPKGSLERATLELFDAADLAVVRSSTVDYRATVDDPRIAEVRILRPQEIPRYVEDGLFDLGITGRDWIAETGAEVVSLGELAYSKATSNPIRVVLAVAEGSPVTTVADLACLGARPRVSTEYPELTGKFLSANGVDADIRLSYGATEAKIPDIADAVVEITETGRALHAAGLRILDTVLVSRTELVANVDSAADPDRFAAMCQLRTLLQGALEARDKVLVKLNVSAADFDAVLGVLPSARTPTVSQLSGEDGYAMEAVVPKSQINTLIPALKDAGATDILELALSKIVH
ncbi:MAG: ATP phosphoribosyltransferase, partial [Acidimicrobiales bacterium]